MDEVKTLSNLSERLALDRKSAKVAIVGLGVTGYSVADFLYKLGFTIAIVDSREKPPLLAQISENMPDVAVFTGGFDKEVLNVASHLVVSPGVSISDMPIQKAIVAGAKITGDIDLFACATDKNVVAISGSNGKSTVTTLVGLMAQAAGIKKAVAGGNLGTPALDLLKQEAELYVLELSSFQLERTHLLQAKAATVLNVTVDHMDRHLDMAAYAKAKQRVFNGHGVMVLNADDPMVMAMRDPQRKQVTFSIEHNKADFWLDREKGYLMLQQRALISLKEVMLQGLHNIANVLAALALGQSLGLPEQAMLKVLRQFKGLAHRMQKVAEIKGVSWVNDSKATNIGACIAALQGYNRNVVLIAGGEAKGADMALLKPVVAARSKSVVLIGKDAPLLNQILQDCVPVYVAEQMKDAVKTAASLAVSGDTVLLSPACASLDQFKNYMDRGDRFTEAVLELQR